jgi:NADH-quinone oxidoreductase subunit G
MVEIEGQKRPQISCDTYIKEDMVVFTQSEKIQKVRQNILELELVNHPLDCPICDQAGECDLQDFYMGTSGLYDSRLKTPKVHSVKKVDLGRNIILDKERCVMCIKCVRFTDEVTKTKELQVFNRSDHAVIGVFPGYEMQTKYAMNVVDICPVGALTSKDFRFAQRVWLMDTFDGICNGCSKGCNIHIEHNKKKYQDDKIFRFRPKANSNVNGHYICDDGRLGYKKEIENRLEESYFNNALKDSKDIIKYISKTIKNKTAMVLISPNLSLEQIQAISEFCSETKIPLSGYMAHYLDRTFGDDFLRKNDKSANQAGLKKNKIKIGKKFLLDNLQNSKHIIIIDNNILDNVNKNKTTNKEISNLLDKKEIFLFSCQDTLTKVKAKLPLPSFYEQNGEYINCDGIIQKVKHNMNKNTSHLNMSEYIKILKERVK